MRREFKPILILTFFIIQRLCSAQSLTVIFTDVGETRNCKISTIRCGDSLAIQKILNEFLFSQFRKGFIAASIDTFRCESNHFIASGIKGSQYRWVNLFPDSATKVLLNDAGIKTTKLLGKPINPKLLAKYFNSMLHQLEDIGYPFAKVRLDNVNISRNSISSIVKIEKGTRVAIDTIYLKGDARINSKKVSAIINLRKGDFYSESKIKRIDQRLAQQQYLNVIKPSEIEFLNRKARVYCYLENKAASRFWGLAGFYSDKTDGKIKLNGDINLSLVNSLRRGEKINFTWSAPGKGTQNLNISSDYYL